MIAEKLRKSILQAAIQGKLTEQRSEDGDARELLAEIKAEKARLVKEGKIKKEKPLPEIAEEEIPFDIPEKWCWVRLGDLSIVINGDRGKNYPGKSFWINEGVPFINAGALNNDVLNSEGFNYIGEKRFQMLRAGFIEKNDILYCLRGSLGKFSLNLDYHKGAIASSLAIIRNVNSELCRYFITYLKSPLAAEMVKRVNNGTAQPNLSADNVKKYIIPMPPFAEQQRIVKATEEAFEKIKDLEKDEQKLDFLQKSFPKKMKDSLLQAAIRGKLTEQLEADGDARALVAEIQKEKARLIKEGKIKKEKALPEITEEELPFEIPDSWCWVRLNHCLDVRDGTHDTPKYVAKGIPLITSKNLSNGELDYSTAKFISEEDSAIINNRSRVDDGDILFAMIGSIGNPVLIKKELDFSIKNVALFKNVNRMMNMQYVYLFLMFEQYAMKRISSGGVQSFVSLSFLRSYLMPLPPLAEQQRIVERLEQLLPLCDTLE